MCGWDACRRELCRRMCSLDEAERSIHTIAHRLLILEYLSLRPCRRAAYIRRKSLLKKRGHSEICQFFTLSIVSHSDN